MAERGITPSQTVGPFFNFALTPGSTYGGHAVVGNDLVTADAVGEVVAIAGRVTDGKGDPVPDALVEIWQADGAGRFAGAPLTNTTFRGFGRSPTTADGGFAFRTVRPGSVPGPDGRPQAPHIDVGVFARGLHRRLFTRLYFEGDPANERDAALALVGPDRRATLVARRDGTANGSPRYVFDIRLQGDRETVFFEA